jgi:hypothetical protein
MGARLSIDKHVSPLEDILELNPKRLANTRFESDTPDSITQHIKVRKLNISCALNIANFCQ